MQEVSKYTVFNIREYLNGNNEELGEDGYDRFFPVFM